MNKNEGGMSWGKKIGMTIAGAVVATGALDAQTNQVDFSKGIPADPDGSGTKEVLGAVKNDNTYDSRHQWNGDKKVKGGNAGAGFDGMQSSNEPEFKDPEGSGVDRTKLSGTTGAGHSKAGPTIAGYRATHGDKGK